MKDALAGREATVPPGAMEWVYSKDAARGTVMALDAKDLGSGVFNLTMGALTTPAEMAEAIQAVVPGAKVKFEAPAGTGVSLSNRAEPCGLEPRQEARSASSRSFRCRRR